MDEKKTNGVLLHTKQMVDMVDPQEIHESLETMATAVAQNTIDIANNAKEIDTNHKNIVINENRINSIEQTRYTKDEVDAKEKALNDKINDTNTAIETEKTTRKENDETIIIDLENAKQNWRDADDESKERDKNLQGQISTNKLSIDAEISNRIDAFYELQGDIETETTNRTNADKTLQENIDKKQDKLVSGTNIKTINNNSLLGSGDIGIHLYEHSIHMTTTGVNIYLRIYNTTQTAMTTTNIAEYLKARPDVFVSISGTGNYSGTGLLAVTMTTLYYSTSDSKYHVTGVTSKLSTTAGSVASKYIAYGTTAEESNFITWTTTDTVIAIF